MKTLHYFFSCWWKTVKHGNPNKRVFRNFVKMVSLEIKCMFLTGQTTDEILNRTY